MARRWSDLTWVLVLGLALVALTVVLALAKPDGGPPWGAGAVVGLIIVGLAAVAVAGTATWVLWLRSRPPGSSSETGPAPEVVLAQAEARVGAAAATVATVADPQARQRLEAELAQLEADRQARAIRVVVFGTGSAGKTSLINALMGQAVGAVGPTMGTTQAGATFDHTLEGRDGTLILTDTPGLSDIGAGGPERQAEALALADRADLLLLVVDHDLTRSEFEPLAELARHGKRAIVVLNKADRFPPADLAAIQARLRERLGSIVPPEDIVAVAAAPRPVPVRVQHPDGTTTTELEAEPPDLGDLDRRIATVLDREGDALRAANLLRRAELVDRAAREQQAAERRAKAVAVVEKYQWVTAGAVFANPLPAVDLLAAGAVQYQMVQEIADAYGVAVTPGHARLIGTQMAQTILRLGLVEAATSLVAGVFKSSLIGFAAGGAIQATATAYLTHLTGLATIDYFEHGQSWGNGGLQAALVRQFDLHRRVEFLRDFARQAVDRVVSRFTGTRPDSATLTSPDRPR